MARLILVRFRQHTQGKNLDNNMTWEEVDPPATPITPSQWCDDFWDAFGPLVYKLQAESVIYDYLDVRDVNDPTWFYRKSLAADTINRGFNGGQALPYFNAVTFTFNRTSLDGGYGHMRVRTYTEDMQNAGVPSTQLIDDATDFMDFLTQQFTDSEGGDYMMRILERTRVPSNKALPFDHWEYTPRAIGGPVFVGLTHKVQR